MGFKNKDEINARRRARYAERKMECLMMAIAGEFHIERLHLYVPSFKNLMVRVRYVRFMYKGYILWLRMRITMISGDMRIGRVWTHPINP